MWGVPVRTTPAQHPGVRITPARHTGNGHQRDTGPWWPEMTEQDMVPCLGHGRPAMPVRPTARCLSGTVRVRSSASSASEFSSGSFAAGDDADGVAPLCPASAESCESSSSEAMSCTRGRCQRSQRQVVQRARVERGSQFYCISL